MIRRVCQLPLLLLLIGFSACEVVDRVRDRGGSEEPPEASATAGGLTLGLQIPGMLSPGQEGTVRLSLTNRGDSVPGQLRLDLIVPGWLELAPPRPGEREVTMAAERGGETRFSYRMDDPPLRPGETQIVEQRLRIPQDSPGPAAGLGSRVIRARLMGAGDESLTEVQTEIALDSTFLARAGAADVGAAVRRDRLGPASLGMSGAELRGAAAGARDTTWSQEGMTERGLMLQAGGGGEALAVLSGDSVVRIEVRDSVVRTREGLGVGSTLEELRATYGRTCGAVGEGIVVVWFPAAAGISFALDSPMSAFLQVDRQPERLPGSARVTRWWLRQGTDDCPVAGG